MRVSSGANIRVRRFLRAFISQPAPAFANRAPFASIGTFENICASLFWRIAKRRRRVLLCHLAVETDTDSVVASFTSWHRICNKYAGEFQWQPYQALKISLYSIIKQKLQDQSLHFILMIYPSSSCVELNGTKPHFKRDIGNIIINL